MLDPRSQTYLSWASTQSGEERDLRARILSALPAEIVDVHAHANGAEAVRGLSEYAERQVRSSFPGWSLEDSRGVQELLFGPIKVRRLWFAQPYKGIDHAAANRYLESEVDGGDRIALCGLPDDFTYTAEQLTRRAYAALKMYPHYFEPCATTVAEFFPPRIVAVADETDSPLILHLATPLSDSWKEVVSIAESHPELTIMLAHLGRVTAVSPEARAGFRAVARHPNIVTDCSMATDRDVYRLALDEMGPSRVLYGSDEPMNLLRYVPFEHPERGRRLVSPRRYHWLDEDMYEEFHHLAKSATMLHWQVLRTLLDAIQEAFSAGDQRRALESVFHDNAIRWFPRFQQ